MNSLTTTASLYGYLLKWRATEQGIFSSLFFCLWQSGAWNVLIRRLKSQRRRDKVKQTPPIGCKKGRHEAVWFDRAGHRVGAERLTLIGRIWSNMGMDFILICGSLGPSFFSWFGAQWLKFWQHRRPSYKADRLVRSFLWGSDEV